MHSPSYTSLVVNVTCLKAQLNDCPQFIIMFLFVDASLSNKALAYVELFQTLLCKYFY